MKSSTLEKCVVRLADREELAPYVEEAEAAGILLTRLDEVYVARVDGVVAGFGGIVMYRDHAKLKAFYVRPEYRSRGIGKALLDYRIKRIREKEYEYAVATVTPASLRMYLRAGASLTRRYKNGCHGVRIDL